MKYILPLLLSVFIFQQSLAQDYVPGLIVVKLKDENQSNRKKSSESLSLELLEKDSKVEKNPTAWKEKMVFFKEILLKADWIIFTNWKSRTIFRRRNISII